MEEEQEAGGPWQEKQEAGGGLARGLGPWQQMAPLVLLDILALSLFMGGGQPLGMCSNPLPRIFL
jgi:hypothetical protein